MRLCVCPLVGQIWGCVGIEKAAMIHVYTGDGKGKTTAAIGLAIRAAGAGFRVYIMQFVKGRKYCEHAALNKLKAITVEQCGRRCFISGIPTEKDYQMCQNGFSRIQDIVRNGRYDMVVLDEICIALSYKLISRRQIEAFVRNVPDDIELVLTGRNAPRYLIAAADLVSEIKEVKHYYSRGVRARRGIEF